jgi:5-carboxymethyl-2-hydroxymuconate isomerase
MPHFHVDYSANLEERLEISGLLAVLRDAAMETGVFPLAGIRIRATACDHWIIADGNPDHAFLDISIRLRAGRSPEAKKQATEHIFAAAEAYLASDADGDRSLASCSRSKCATSIPELSAPRPEQSASTFRRILDSECPTFQPEC